MIVSICLKAYQRAAYTLPRVEPNAFFIKVQYGCVCRKIIIQSTKLTPNLVIAKALDYTL